MTMANRKFWKVSAGKNGNMWEEFQKESCIKINYGVTDNLSNFSNTEAAFKKDLKEKGYSTGFSCLWNIYSQISPNDVVIIFNASDKILALAVITSPYQFGEKANGYRHYRAVNFLIIGDKNYQETNIARLSLYELKSEDIINHILFLYDLNKEKLEKLIKTTTQILEVVINQEELAKYEPTEIIGMEGKVREALKLHLYTERDKKFVERYKQRHIIELGKVKCEACYFDSEKSYTFGLKAENFLQLHHIEPLANRKSTENSETREENVVLLCPNCHVAIHRLMTKEYKVISVEELQLHLFPY
jgi:predicted HNH restriction endonuclease